MDRDEQVKNYNLLKSKLGLKEYVFSTPAGFRQFFVLGKDLEDAEKNFMRIDSIERVGFTLDDLPVRVEFDEKIHRY